MGTKLTKGLTNFLKLSGGAMTGAITTSSTFDGVDIATRDALLSTTIIDLTATTVTANAALPKAGGTMTGDLILSGTNTDVVLAATAKLRLDGSASGDSYIYEHGADSVRFLVGGDEMLRLDEAGTAGNMVLVKEGCVAFTQETETFDDTPITSTSGSNDTDIDFRHTNKIKIAVTATMNDMNLIFPGGSGNFQLLVTYSGDYSIDSWKVFDKTGSAVTAANVLWAGGSEPDPTASGVDIFSFYWDAGGETAYGVASLNFVAGD